MPMCSSQVLLGLESSAHARSRSHRSRADVCESIPVGGCKYERYVLYVSTDEQGYHDVAPLFSAMMTVI